MNLKAKLGIAGLRLDVFEKILLFAPIFIWFSYYPRANFGGDSTMYFKLSLTMVYVLVLSIAGLPKILKNWRSIVRQPAFWIVSIFLLWQAISLFWSANLVRGCLTLGVSGMLFLILLACIQRKGKIREMLPALTRLLMISAVFVGLLAVLQMIFGLWLPKDQALLCNGCVAAQFGFVRPNVFAIEPQFLGSLLLAPILILAHIILSKKSGKREKLILWFLIFVLFLTLSRGAIFAFGVGLLVLFAVHYQQIKNIIVTIGITIASLIMAIGWQGFLAAINDNYDQTFSEAVSVSVNQLSMGLINLELPDNTSQTVESSAETTEAGDNEPAFDGYVEESTNVRLNLSQTALEAWSSNLHTMLFGTGLGSAGIVMSETNPALGSREIVQNEYIEVLLERGLIGFMLFAIVIASLVHSVRRQKWLWAVILAFMVQWNFFSGYPSALHIYLLLIVIFILPRDQSKLAKQS